MGRCVEYQNVQTNAQGEYTHAECTGLMNLRAAFDKNGSFIIDELKLKKGEKLDYNGRVLQYDSKTKTSDGGYLYKGLKGSPNLQL